MCEPSKLQDLGVNPAHRHVVVHDVGESGLARRAWWERPDPKPIGTRDLTYALPLITILALGPSSSRAADRDSHETAEPCQRKFKPASGVTSRGVKNGQPSWRAGMQCNPLPGWSRSSIPASDRPPLRKSEIRTRNPKQIQISNGKMLQPPAGTRVLDISFLWAFAIVSEVVLRISDFFGPTDSAFRDHQQRRHECCPDYNNSTAFCACKGFGLQPVGS